ncbi:MAG TPA: SMI1/KNR4 family protein, partial [Acidobacteriota bacterium]|nr:SMI1/KNR4 family protein [Acidobacteriota bacterium]
MADRVTQAEKALVRQYLQVYTDQLSNQLASAPDEIREDVVLELLNWSSSGVTIEQIEAVEGSLPIKLPPILVAYLQSGFQSGVDQHGYYLPGAPSNTGEPGIIDYVNSQELWPLGYLEIASNASGDPICLDFFRARENGDFPVVLINHDIVPAQAWESRGVMEEWAEEIFPSFQLFLEFLCLGPASSNVEDIDGWQLWLEPVTQLT